MKRSTTHMLLMTGFAASMLYTSVLAQQTADQPIKPVDQTVADLDPLLTSFRDMQVDLRQPLGFQGVYRVPGQEDKFMRSSGALYAVFPHSIYTSTKKGIAPLVPAGTVYYIGLPVDMQTQPAGRDGTPAPKNRVDDRLQSHFESRLPHQVNAPLAEQSKPSASPRVDRIDDRYEPSREHAITLPVGSTIVNDESYRARRIAELMDRAVQAHATRSR